jgi:aminoglycoside phosphotransferase (APT) family kinase protein
MGEGGKTGREGVVARLRDAGIDIAAGEIVVEARDGRTIARLPGDRVAWLADTDAGLRELAKERRVLRLIEARCAFRVPRIVYESEDHAFDVREAVPGATEPWKLYARVIGDAKAGARIGEQIGAILAEQHTRIDASDADWLPPRPIWPEPHAWILERVARVISDAALVRRIDALIARVESIAIADSDRALVHADLGLHNLAVDPASLEVRGVFDYGDSAWADRHHDFRYLLFDTSTTATLDAAIAVYEPRVGVAISRERVALYNAACATSFLAFRDGVAPETKWCGRTLEQDLGWTRAALDRAGVAA